MQLHSAVAGGPPPGGQGPARRRGTAAPTLPGRSGTGCTPGWPRLPRTSRPEPDPSRDVLGVSRETREPGPGMSHRPQPGLSTVGCSVCGSALWLVWVCSVRLAGGDGWRACGGRGGGGVVGGGGGGVGGQGGGGRVRAGGVGGGGGGWGGGRWGGGRMSAVVLGGGGGDGVAGAPAGPGRHGMAGRRTLLRRRR